MNKEDIVVMRHGDINDHGIPNRGTITELHENVPELSDLAQDRKIIVYHSEQVRAQVTAWLLSQILREYDLKAEVGGYLDELHSEDPLLRSALRMNVEDGTFVVLISHEPLMKQVFKEKDIPYCRMFKKSDEQ